MKMNNIYMNDYEQNIIKLRETTFYDVSSEILDYFRMSNEKLILDYTRLLIE